MGWPVPAGKCLLITCSPTTESGVVVNASALVRPSAFRERVPKATAPSTTLAATQVSRGRRAIATPTRAHKLVWVWSGVPKDGRIGQNTHRPQITSRAGSKVSMASTPTPMPIAATGPRPEVEFKSANSRHSMPTMTVAALATIAGPARCSATAIASCRSSCLRNSSR
jgi:hypothetical protein